MSSFPATDHAHSACVDTAHQRFDAVAAASGKRPGIHVKPVFDVLLSQHRAFTAYEVIDQLADKGKRLQATQVYRALEELIEMELIHRIETKNAYMACHNGEGCHRPQLFICTSCDRVAEINSDPIQETITKTAQSSGFVVESQKVELLGLCPDCA